MWSWIFFIIGVILGVIIRLLCTNENSIIFKNENIKSFLSFAFWVVIISVIFFLGYSLEFGVVY